MSKDVDILKAYKEAHDLATHLGMEINPYPDCFVLRKDGETLVSKMKIKHILAFLEGYAAGQGVK